MDNYWMRMAIAQSEKARLLSPPNPWVGSVIVKNETCVGKGFTQAPGGHHAEIVALQEAKEKAKDATLYVTLEPCSHWGRTPPCVDALIQAGLKKVVIGIEDPDIQVKGNGIKKLMQAGIEVTIGVENEQIEQSLEPYLFHRKYNRPFCILKTAISIDGRIAAQDGTSQWITDTVAREDVHRLRAHCQGILVGAGSATKDQPQLTVRHPTLKPHVEPLRIVCNASGSLESIGPLFETTSHPTLIFTSFTCPTQRIEEWQKFGVEVHQVPDQESKLDLETILSYLAGKGILQLLVEGGPTIQENFFKQNLVQEWHIYTGNCLLGVTGIPLFPTYQVDTIKNCPRMRLKECIQLGNSSRQIWSFNNN